MCVSERVFPVLSLTGVFPAAQINGLILDNNPSIGKQTWPDTAHEEHDHTSCYSHTNKRGCRGSQSSESKNKLISMSCQQISNLTVSAKIYKKKQAGYGSSLILQVPR